MNYRSLLFIAALSAGTNSALATDYTWIGGASAGNDNILNPAFWQGSSVPPNDGTNINLPAGDRIIMTNNQYMPDAGGRQINVASGAEITMGVNGGNSYLDARVNLSGDGIGGGGVIKAGPTSWGNPQNLFLNTDASITTSGNQRFRMDGGPNRLDLNNKILTVGGAGETNFVNTNIQANGGRIISNHILSAEGDTTFNSGITIDMAPGVGITGWDSFDNRNDAKINLGNNSYLETRKNDRDLAFTNEITIANGATGVLNAVIQAQGQPEDGRDLRLQITGTLKGTGAISRQGNGTVVLTGNNTYSGGTNLNNAAGARTLVGSNTAFGTGTVNVNQQSVLDFSNAGGLEYRDGDAFNAAVGGTPVGINPALTGLHSSQAFDNTRFSYVGKIRNTTGGNVVYSFAEQFDDEVYLEVNGTVILQDANWNGATSGQITLAPGEHDIRVSARNGGGGAGPNSGWEAGISQGVGISTALPLGGATTNKADYLKLGDAYQIYQPVDRTVANNIALNQNLTMSTSKMNGYKATVSGAVSGVGSLTVEGDATLSTDELILTGTNNYAGSTTVLTGSIFRQNGSHTTTGSYVVDSGGTMTQSGSLIVSPSTGPNAASELQFTNNGSASLLSGSNIQLDLFTNVAGAVGSSSGENDQITLLGSNSLTLGGSLTVANPNGISSWTAGDSWHLFEYFQNPTGTFATLNLPSLPPSFTWDTSDLYVGGNISIIPIPEPGTTVLGLAGLVLLARRRRK
jgi:fibronectin-binding autotransporter adhesin